MIIIMGYAAPMGVDASTVAHCMACVHGLQGVFVTPEYSRLGLQKCTQSLGGFPCVG